MSLRQHLLVTCSECEVLTKLYKKQLTSLDNEECHTHLRCVPFDLSLRLPGDKTLDQFVRQAREVGKGDSRLDRYNPAKLHLAVQELDEKHVGCFSFRTKADISKVCIQLHTGNREESYIILWESCKGEKFCPNIYGVKNFEH